MKTEQKKAFFRLVLDYIHTMGASKTTLVALEAYIHAIGRLATGNRSIKDSVQELNQLIRQTEPIMTSLVHFVDDFESQMEQSWEGSPETAKKRAVEILRNSIARFESDTRRVTKNCMDCIAEGDFIIAHSPTGYIRDALVRARTELNRAFKVLILKDDFVRTKELVKSLEQNSVYHAVIPEHNLSHFLKQVNKLFVSAVSITSDNKAVAAIGTANVVGLCHWNRIPVYLFAESVKFSRAPLPEHRIHKEEEDRVEADFVFHMTTFSHDFVDLAMVDHLVTEKEAAR